MPGLHKRTRSSTVTDENAESTPAASSSRPRRAVLPSTPVGPIAPTPVTTTPTTAMANGANGRPSSSQRDRIPSTRSTTQTLASQITRAASLFTPSTRRSANSGSGSGSDFATPPPRVAGQGLISAGGMLLRTQSTSAIPSPTSLKAIASGGSGGFAPDKGGDDLGAGPSGKRWGKGKENIPPKKGEEPSIPEGSRKRLRVGSTRDTRGRSGSVSSLRSETPSTSSRPSLGPSSSFTRQTSRLLSPSPSPSSATTQSLETISSDDTLDCVELLDNEDDTSLEKTPTKPKARQPQRYGIFPTPPPSSPLEFAQEVEVEITTRRMGLVRMQSGSSTGKRSRSASRDDSVFPEGMEKEDSRRANPYKHLKSFLRLSAGRDDEAIDQAIIGRDSEKMTLRTYLASAERSVGLYVSGPPGTGKTALVTALGKEMRGDGWAVAELGCMGLKITDIWHKLGESLQCGKTEAEVYEHLKNCPSDLMIILDEVDSLLPPSPALPPPATSHLLSKLFSLPLAAGTKTVKLVAISNTLDLTIRARLVLPDNLQPQVLPFKAYGAADMSQIVLARIARAAEGRVDAETVKVEAKAVELLTRKVEASNGDLRNCLGCLTSAVSLAEAEWIKKTSLAKEAEDATTFPLIKVALPHTIKAFNSHTQQLKAAAGTSGASASATSATSKKIRSVPLQGKMVLVSILIYISRLRAGLPGSPAISSSSNTPSPPTTPTKAGEALTTSTLYATYAHLLSHNSSPFPPSPESDYRDLLSNLEVLGLVSTTQAPRGKSHGAGAGGAKVELRIRDEEVKEGLGLLTQAGTLGLADEEVRKVWEREGDKIRRTRERAERAAFAATLEDN